MVIDFRVILRALEHIGGTLASGSRHHEINNKINFTGRLQLTPSITMIDAQSFTHRMDTLRLFRSATIPRT